MTTSSVKRALCVLLGLLLTISLICVSAAGQRRSKSKRQKARRAMMAVTGETPTNLEQYTCNDTETLFMRFDYTRNMPDNGFLGNQYTTIVFPRGGERTTAKAVQWYNGRTTTNNGGGMLWGYQAQDGSFLCPSVFVSTDKRTVIFSACRNLPDRTCRQ